MEEKQLNTLKVPNIELRRMYVTHLGIIFSNLSIAMLVLGLASLFVGFFSALVTMIWIMLWFAGLIFSVGTIFVMVPNYLSWLTNTSKFLDAIPFQTFFQIVKYLLPIGIVLGVCSIICLSFDKHKNHRGRIIFSSIVLALLVITFVIVLIGGLAK